MVTWRSGASSLHYFIFFVYIGREMSVESLDLSPSPKFRFFGSAKQCEFWNNEFNHMHWSGLLCCVCLWSAWNVSLLWGSGCDLTTASVITCCVCQISAPGFRALRPAPKPTQWRGVAGRLCAGSDGFNTFNRTQSQRRHFCTESTRSPTHGKTTVRWYSQLVTPWELAVSHANGDQCTDSWICFFPELLIIEVTLL